MNDQSRKLQEMKENSEAVFQELFGIETKKVSPEEQAQAQAEIEAENSGDIQKISEGKYRLGNSIITGVKGVSEHTLLNFSFKESSLSWLAEAQFEGVLTLSLIGDEKVKDFQGMWKSGIFKGERFGIKSMFLGGQFGDSDAKPTFFPKYTNWKASPAFFYDGLMDQTSGGVLGIKNLEIGAIENAFSLLAISPNNTVTIELNGGIKHSITCINRFGGKNSRMFSYKVTNGKTNQTYDIVHDWSELRGNPDSDNGISFLKKTNINLQTATKTIDIFRLDISEGIVSAAVSVAGTSGAVGSDVQKSQKELATSQESYELAKIPFLGIAKIPRRGGSETSIYFNFPTENHQKGYQNAVKSLEQHWIKSYITQINSALANNIVTGAPVGYKFLEGLIGKDSDADVNAMDKDLINAFNGLENFLKYFVDTMVRRVRKTGAEKGIVDVQDTVGKDVIKNKIRGLLGVSSPKTAVNAPVVPKKAPLKQPMAEGVRGVIRKILGEI